MNLHRLVILATLALAWATTPSRASLVVYTSRSDFLTAVQPGSGEESFDGLPTGLGPQFFDFAPDGVRFNALTSSTYFFPFTIPGGDPADVILSTNSDRDFAFYFNQQPITAFGADLFVVDFDGKPVNGATFEIDIFGDPDGPRTFTTTAAADTFVGFTSTTPFSFIRITPIGPANFAAANNAIVGVAVPEPATLTMLGLGLLGVAGLTLRPGLLTS